MKVVVNRCYGGFGLSRVALHRLRELGSKHALAEVDTGEPWHDSGEVREASPLTSFLSSIPRDDTLLIQVLDELGEQANGRFAKLEAVEVPDGVRWEIGEYDGMESVEEAHRSW